MKVYIRDIRPEGVEMDDTLASEAIGLTEEDYVQFPEPLSVHAKIERAENTVISRVSVRGRFRSFCCRSLVEVERDWNQDFLLDFEISSETEFIELDEDIRQEIIMNLPMRVLSDEEMKKEEFEQERKEANRIENVSKDETQPATYKPFEKLKDIE